MARILITSELFNIISDAREKKIFSDDELRLIDEDVNSGSLGIQSLVALRAVNNKNLGSKSICDSLIGHKQVLLFNRKIKTEIESEEARYKYFSFFLLFIYEMFFLIKHICF